MITCLRLYLSLIFFGIRSFSTMAADDSKSYENWMGLMFSAHEHLTLPQIYIPGTHNSATYAIDSSSQATPGSFIFLFGIPFYSLPIVHSFVLSWAICQTRTITEQLNDGIRSFDLRISEHNNQLVIDHGLISIALDDVLTQFSTFSHEHPKEILIIMTKNSYEFDASHSLLEREGLQQKAAIQIAKKLSGLINENYQPSDSLKEIWASKRSLIINPDLQGKWLNQNDISGLRIAASNFLEGQEAHRLSNLSLFLTPNAATVVTNVLPNSLPRLAVWQEGVLRHLGDWLVDWHCKGKRLNIVSVDFYQLSSLVPTLMMMNQEQIQTKVRPSSNGHQNFQRKLLDMVP